MSGRPPLAVLVGPTGAGKTQLACALAAELDAEVVSADSQQCYRGLDAGTAKPDAVERARAPHHLLDVAWPEEQLDAAAFVRLADAAIEGLSARGKRALVVGGTGLWIRALLRGLLEAPGRDEGFRARFRAELDARGLPALHARLREVDPAAAASIRPGDRVRIERALEVHAATGRKLSDLQREHGFRSPRYRARVVLLDPPAKVLRERLELRTQAFFAGGLEAPLLRETAALLRRVEQVPEAARALKIIGYGEAAQALREPPDRVAEGLRRAREATLSRTWQYARRQRTWFRKDAQALDEAGSPLIAAGAQDAARLCPALREWYEAAR